MPVFRLTEDLVFPPAHLAEEGLLAIGGDLSQDRLLLAYRHGLFPWYSTGEPILWWSPDPRMILIPDEMHVSRSLRRSLRAKRFRFRFDRAFSEVIAACATTPRPGQDGTWITPEMLAAYTKLHHAGYAHSLEAWEGGHLAGGLYGICLGGCFFGESMFSHSTDASKAALAVFTQHCPALGIGLIDCQVENPHLASLGARNVSRARFLAMLKKALRVSRAPASWRDTELRWKN